MKFDVIWSQQYIIYNIYIYIVVYIVQQNAITLQSYKGGLLYIQSLGRIQTVPHMLNLL